MNISHYRLCNQQIVNSTCRTPAEVVARLGAVQAQDFPGAKWSLALRLAGATDADIIRAIDERSIVRTWPMRGTLHFVAADDVRWMLRLMTPRVVAGSASRARQLRITDALIAQCCELFVRALEGGKQLARDEMYTLMEQHGIATVGQRGNHILWRAAQQGILCFASHQEKQPAFALLDEWIPVSRELSREEALGELALRYFTGHGPATLHDLAWWSGLKVSEVREALALVAPKLLRENVAGVEYWMASAPTVSPLSTAFLLPGFDEYLLGYKDRTAVLNAEHASRVVPGSNGMFMPTIVVDGRVVGLWKRTLRKRSVSLELQPFAPLSPAHRAAVDYAAEHYGMYLGLSASVL